MSNTYYVTSTIVSAEDTRHIAVFRKLTDRRERRKKGKYRLVSVVMDVLIGPGFQEVRSISLARES